jgi:gas vesicle structural protein
MKVERAQPQASVTEVLDRVLDRGIVIDAWVRVSVAGITLIDLDARIVVASIDTYVQRADAIATAQRPALAPAPNRKARSRGQAAARPARARARRLPMRCDDGCTFVRRSSGSATSVRCPSDRRRVCPVVPVPAPA